MFYAIESRICRRRFFFQMERMTSSHSTFHRPDFYKKVVRLAEINRSTLMSKI
jgi:hypothetical protein